MKTVGFQNPVTSHASDSEIVSCGTKESVFVRFFAFLGKKFLTGSESYEIEDVSRGTNVTVPHETTYRPEDNLHPWKLARLRRTIQTYLAEKGETEECDWRFDAICVYLNEKDKKAKMDWLQDIIL